MKLVSVTEAVLKTITLPTTTGNVDEILSSHFAKQPLEHRKCFMKLLSNASFQDKALRFVEMAMS